MSRRRAVIIGGGPAGLTAALELLRTTDVVPLVLEREGILGGLARTVEYRGNRIDIGGHRFFSKSDRVMDWWLEILPLQATGAAHGAAEVLELAYQGQKRSWQTGSGGEGPDPNVTDRVMLLRSRTSRIYFARQLFPYPLRLDASTLWRLGLLRSMRIAVSYLKSVVFPIRNPRNLEEFFISRFGKELYLTFFKEYTEKVWGVPCHEISPEWGAQRVKGLSIWRAIRHAAAQAFGRLRKGSLGSRGDHGDVRQKTVETSLIERFLYPKLGPGQLWTEVARQVEERGGEILLHHQATGLMLSGNPVGRADGARVQRVRVENLATGESRELEADYVISTMPVRELVAGLVPAAPAAVQEVAAGLRYRDFITVGLLLRRLKLRDSGSKKEAAAGRPEGGLGVADNWIYVQEPGVQVGRVQIFNNWSPWLVADPATVWVGLEYFCEEGDALWQSSDAALTTLARDEMAALGMIDAADVLDATVLRVLKTYPAYLGTYERFGEVRAFLDEITNLFLVGRNGMHRYNNQDHSMLTAMLAVEAVRSGSVDKAPLWAVNAEQEYHEEQR